MSRHGSLFSFVVASVAVVSLIGSGCSGSGSDASTSTSSVRAEEVAATQDLWVIHELNAVGANGDVADVYSDLLALAVSDAGDEIALTGDATFTPSDSLDAHLRRTDGEPRDGVDVVGGVLRGDGSELVALLGTPVGDGPWPGADDLVSFQLPGVDVDTPVVATLELVQLLGTDDEDPSTDPLETMRSRIDAGSYQYAATSDDEPLVFVGQVGMTYAAESGGGRGRAATEGRAASQGGDGSVAGVPAKAVPLLKGMGSGAKKCRANALKCVKDVLGGIEKGAGNSNDMLNDNFPDPPPTTAPPTTKPPTPRPTAAPKTPRPASYCKPTCANSGADPHLRTFDGETYDLQRVGEFVAARNDRTEVQVRTAAVRDSRLVAVNTAVAVQTADHVVQIGFGDGSDVLVDGEAAELGEAIGSEQTHDDLTLTRTPVGVDVAAGDELVLQVHISAASIDISVPGGEVGTEWVGLFGDNDGDAANDLQAADGTVVKESADDFYELHSDQWRVTDDDSLFTYDDGERTEDFTDMSFPEERVDASSLSDQERAQAEALCSLAGIEQAQLPDCVLDFFATGEISMVHSAQQVAAMVLALGMDDPGSFDEALGAGPEGADVSFDGETRVTLRGNGPAVGDELALVRTESDGETHLRAVEVDTGEARWEIDGVSRNCRPVVVPDVGVVAQLNGQVGPQSRPLVLLSADDGSELARFAPDGDTLGECSQTLDVAGDSVLFLADKTLRVLSTDDGLTETWKKEFPHSPAAARGVSDAVVVASRPTDTTTSLVLLDAATGDQVAEQPLSGARYVAAPGVLRDLGDGTLAAINTKHGDAPAALSVLDVTDSAIDLRWELVLDDSGPYGGISQVAASDGVLAAFAKVDGEDHVIGFDLGSGEQVWTHEPSSFDNSAGQIEPVGDRGFAVTPFGGDWIEIVDTDGEALVSIEAPAEDLSGPMITPVDDDRIVAISAVDDGDGGTNVAIVTVP